VRPFSATAQEHADLIAFLTALTGSNVDALTADARTAPVGDR
jgi:hypothetical protein